MNEEHDQFDDFLREVLHEAGPEQAPAHFTQSVMGRITAETARAQRSWKPLISPIGWAAIAACVIALVVLSVVMAPAATQPQPLPGAAQTQQAVETVSSLFGSMQVPTILVSAAIAVLLLFGFERVLARGRMA